MSAGKNDVQEREPIFPARSDSLLRLNESLSKLLTSYIQYHYIEGSTESTVKHKRKEISQFIRFLEAQEHSVAAVDVTSLDVLSHLEEMKLRGLAVASIHTRRRALHAWFAWMVDWDIMAVNPVSKVRAPRLPKIRKPFLDESAFHKLLDLCPLNTLLGSRRASMLWVLVTTGMRRRELSLLTCDDLDWHKGEIRVIHGKGQRERQVPFMREAQLPLSRYLNQRIDSLDCLWISERGAQLSYHGMGEDMHRLFKRADVPVKDAFHIFRRTFAANAVRQGVPRQYTQAIAGWSTSQMLDRYTAAMEAEEEAIEAFRHFKPFGK